MKLKKKLVKSISIALSCVITLTPIFNTAYAMGDYIDKQTIDLETEDYLNQQDKIQNQGIQARTIWDVVDIGMAGASWYTLLKDPSFKNVGWAVLDTAAILPLIPSTAYIRNGSKIIVSNSSLQKLASTKKGKEAIKKSLKVTKQTSTLSKVSKLAKNYKLTNNQYKNHILARHGAKSTLKGKSKFMASFDIKKGIKDTLTNDSIIKNNTKGREGYIFIKTYKNPIGYDSKGKKVKRLKVVLNESGYVVTAYPIK